MNVLGLNFGHDGSVAVMKDDYLAGYSLGERLSRIKHHVGVTEQMISAALDEAGLEISEIDAFAITSTQFVELVTNRLDDFAIRMERHPEDSIRSEFESVLDRSGQEPVLNATLERGFKRKDSQKSIADRIFEAYYPEGAGDWGQCTYGWIDDYVTLAEWQKGATFSELSQRVVKLSESLRFGMHYPVTVSWRGREFPAVFVNHHMAHAAASFYRSGFEKSAILTHDGFGNGAGYHSGLICWGDGSRLWPVAPHHLAIGTLYDRVAVALGLGGAGGPGKLMGLAPYGKPKFFRRSFVGNEYDHRARFGKGAGDAWIAHCLDEGRRLGYDLAPFGDKDQILAPINVDIASSTQKLFEECYLQAVEACTDMLSKSGFSTENLCLSGGTALNCPSNSRVSRESVFSSMFIEPSCDDSGIAIGAAMYMVHNLMGLPPGDASLNSTPYLGSSLSAEISEEFLKEQLDGGLRFEKLDDAPQRAAQDLSEDMVIAWFEGRSEIGPRALGHRSILADPRNFRNWARVNRIKSRELWRPFAPAVLESKVEEWFADCPKSSPYMLFTARVKSRSLPAITHVDGSARIQTVSEASGGFYRLLNEFDRLTGVPVLMNTSFNGPGEPIVELPEQAIELLKNSDLDAVYISGFRISRKRQKLS